MKKVYTDGSYFPQEKVGGYAAYDVEEDFLIFGGSKDTTNNQMELQAVISALKNIETKEIEIVTDSKYVSDAFNSKWIDKWKRNGWQTSTGKDVANKELWTKLDEEVSKKDTVKFTWVKGHSDNPFNELCDQVAKASCGIQECSAHQDKSTKKKQKKK